MTLDTPGLERFARRTPIAAAEPTSDDEHCELCARPIPQAHRHLLDLDSRDLLCVCTACRILFDSAAAGGRHYRLIPERRLRVADADLDDVRWEEFRIPVDVAFFTYSSAAGRVVAMYPGALGAAESALSLESWTDLVRANPVLGTVLPDVEALLVYRAQGARQHFIVPIDDCYRLVGTIRTRWKGFTGGKEVWREIAAFFEDLTARAVSITREDIMDHVKTGKAMAKHDTPSHVRGINEGNAKGHYQDSDGHLANGTSTARRSTGINPDAQEAIDPRMPNLSPA